MGGGQAEEKEMGLIGWDGAEAEEYRGKRGDNKVCRCCRRVCLSWSGEPSYPFERISFQMLSVCLSKQT